MTFLGKERTNPNYYQCSQSRIGGVRGVKLAGVEFNVKPRLMILPLSPEFQLAESNSMLETLQQTT